MNESPAREAFSIGASALLVVALSGVPSGAAQAQTGAPTTPPVPSAGAPAGGGAADPSRGARTFAIGSGPLADVLARFAASAGVQVVIDPGTLAGRTSPGLNGAFTVADGFARLLAGSGYEAVAQPGGGYLLRRIPLVATPLAARAAAGDAATLPAVNVASSRIIDGPQAIRIDRNDIERNNPSDMQDLFRGTPGVDVGSSLPVSQKLYVQGVEETNLAVTIDGSRQNNKIFHHNATTLLDPELLRAVEIDPGVAPADAGPGALAGAVQYETMSVRDMLEPGRSFGGFVKGQYETNGNIFSKSGAVYGTSNGLEFLGFLKGANGGLREDGHGDTIIGSGTSLLSGLGKLAWQAGSGDRLELAYEQVRDDEARPYRANLGRITGGRPVPQTRGYDLQRRNVVLTYTDRTPIGWWDPKIQFARSVTRLGIDEPNQFLEGETASLNGKIENRFRIASGSVTTGFDFYSDRAVIDYRSLTDPADTEAATEKVRNVGLYAQARLNPLEGVRLSFGGRFDRQSFIGTDEVRRSDSGLSANVSGEVDLTRRLSLSAGYAHVWAGVPLAENFIMNPRWDYGTGLEPVTSNNVFLGMRVDLADVVQGLWVDGKVFRTRIDDARTPEYRGGGTLHKDMSSQGYRLGAGYQWTRGHVRLGFADIRSRVDGNPADSETGRYLTTPLGQVISLALVQTVPAWSMTFGADAQFVLKEKDTFDADTGARSNALPSYRVVNAFVSWQPGQSRRLTLRAEVNNLLDSAYASRATYGQEYSTVVPLNEPGRSFKMVASYRF